MINIKSIICYIRAIPQIFRHGFYIPHVYEDLDPELAVIVATDKSFRAYNNDTAPTKLAPGEKMYKHAALIRSRCIYCGKESIGWMQNYDFRNEEKIKQLYPEQNNPEG